MQERTFHLIVIGCLLFLITIMSIVIDTQQAKPCTIIYNELPAQEVEYVDLYINIDDINDSNATIYLKDEWLD